jgi:hypothetical protein
VSLCVFSCATSNAYTSVSAIFESDPADPNVNRKPEKQKRLEIQENHFLEDRERYNNHKSEYNNSNDLIGGLAQSG